LIFAEGGNPEMVPDFLVRLAKGKHNLIFRFGGQPSAGAVFKKGKRVVFGRTPTPGMNPEAGPTLRPMITQPRMMGKLLPPRPL